jgi:integrase/recombinase XerD
MRKQFNSNYAGHLHQFIEMKRKLGFKFTTPAAILLGFDRFAVKNKETGPGITKEFAEIWSKRRPNESERYRYDRVRITAQFSLYLCDLGIVSYIPKLPPYPSGTFIPYIYSEKEMAEIFKAADGLRLTLRSMNSSLFSIPALLRLLYSTGIRIGEALFLRDEDINLEEHFLRVKDSKNGKERIIPISGELVSICDEYLKFRSKLPLGKRESAYFFVSLNGRKCGYNSVGNWFKKCLEKSAIGHVGRNQLPRIHDLRHTFAVKSMANMADAGIDLYASLPILSTYLGHQSLGATNHYVRLTANIYPDLIKDVDMICLDVFPKINKYEAD